MGKISDNQSSLSAVQIYPHRTIPIYVRKISFYTRYTHVTQVYPHIWGKFFLRILVCVNFGFIPAYARKIQTVRPSFLWCWGHPHIYEESLSPICNRKCFRGFIPTYVGKIAISRINVSTIRDHPHIRGENLFVEAIVNVISGLPPHTWGKYPAEISFECIVRFIPT